MASENKILHGNKAKIDKHAPISSVYETLTLTNKKDDTSDTNIIIDNDSVAKAKEYVDENHK